MFERVPGVRVFSEPWSYWDLHLLFKTSHISFPQYKLLLQAAARIQMRKTKESLPKPTHYVFKFTTFNIAQTPLLHEFFPDAKFYLLTRHMEGMWKVKIILKQKRTEHRPMPKFLYVAKTFFVMKIKVIKDKTYKILAPVPTCLL